jgi:hypothetical protein
VLQACLTIIFLACSSTKATQQARSSGDGHGLSDNAEVPPELAAMLAQGPCIPQLRGPLEERVLTDKDDPQSKVRVFVMGMDERLCVVGELEQPTDAPLELSRRKVEPNGATDALVSVETRATSVGTVMVVHNYHPRPLHYRLIVRYPGQKPQAAGVCPVRPGLASVEHWSQAVEFFFLSEFQLLDADADASCR